MQPEDEDEEGEGDVPKPSPGTRDPTGLRGLKKAARNLDIEFCQQLLSRHVSSSEETTFARMKFSLKRISFYSLAIAVGMGAFGMVWLPQAMAATMYCKVNGTATVCYQKVTYNNVAPLTQATYLAHGGTCGPCGKPPTSPVSGPP